MGRSVPTAGERRPSHRVLAVVAVGGACGAVARHLLTTALPYGEVGSTWSRFPWATALVNVSGCLLLGVLVVLVPGGWTASTAPTGAPLRGRGRGLLRPFLGVGVLGGWTTFSTYGVDVLRLLADGDVLPGLVYAAGSVLAGVAAAAAGMRLARRIRPAARG